MSKRSGFLLLLFLATLGWSEAFHGVHPLPNQARYASPRAKVQSQPLARSPSERTALIRREVVAIIPQVLFVAACAGAVFGYVATHIDEIVAKQKVAVEKTMTKQNADLKSAQQQQKEAIDAAMKKQQAAIKKIQEDQNKR
ncbi:hypothetical protein NSK_006115 [Nannochloropsis salina CCMP1776]|uniref:Uncharacterized protein n=1 Tax=Nannochloropsis salina CCMP1776 TaxID=1027361 RepID=A0A4D9CTV5_9STRA|nr:hypothetical protein NSK_006115 [Nannochloropsis salina CCMP1776]|eukprot:TFJ82691.1 hypothetical protein NSK_006115 [Nannochloropsis salina CCMP1776]